LKRTLMIFLIFAQLDFAKASDLSQSSTSPALMRSSVWLPHLGTTHLFR
jgi:hypothetical protein